MVLNFVFVQSAYSQTFEVKALSEDVQEATLRDRGTGKEWAVRKGDEIRGWMVLDMKLEYVTIVMPVEGGGIVTPGYQQE